MAAPLGGGVTVRAGHGAAAGVRVEGADRAADVGSVGEQGAAGGKGVAGGWGEAAWDPSQAGAGARGGQQVAGRLGCGTVERQASPVHFIAVHRACIRAVTHGRTVTFTRGISFSSTS